MQLPGIIKPGTRIAGMVQNLDFAPTFLDLAGGHEYTQNMQGESFKALLEGKTEDFKNVIYYHYYDYPAFHMVKRHYGVRTKRYKLIHFYDDIDSWEFYDLDKDSLELHNAINEPSYKDIIVDLRQKLDSVQKHYGVSAKEFETSPKEKVDKAYDQFKRLRGIPMK